MADQDPEPTPLPTTTLDALNRIGDILAEIAASVSAIATAQQDGNTLTGAMREMGRDVHRIASALELESAPPPQKMGTSANRA